MDASTADALLELAEDARERTRREDPAGAAALESRYAELLEALDWFRDDGRPERALRMATALVPFWLSTRRIDEGDAWFAATLARHDIGDAARARAVYDHAYLVFWAGRYDAAAEGFRDARARAAALHDPTLEALSLAGLARVALNTDVAEAERLLRQAVAVTDGTEDGEGRSSALHVLGVALQMSGDLEGARQVMTDRLELGRQQGQDFVVWVESANLSMVERQLGNLDRAEALSRDALRIVGRRGDAMAVPWVLNGLAAVTAARGDLERAATLNGLAAALLEQAGGEWPPDERQQYEDTLAAVTAALTPEAVDRARAAGAAMTPEEGVAYALADPGR